MCLLTAAYTISRASTFIMTLVAVRESGMLGSHSGPVRTYKTIHTRINSNGLLIQKMPMQDLYHNMQIEGRVI